MKSELIKSVRRGEESRQLLFTWLPIFFNIVLTVGVAIITLIPINWLVRVLLIVVFVMAAYRYCFYSRSGKTRIWNFLFHIKKAFDSNDF